MEIPIERDPEVRAFHFQDVHEKFAISPLELKKSKDILSKVTTMFLFDQEK